MSHILKFGSMAFSFGKDTNGNKKITTLRGRFKRSIRERLL